MFYISHAETRRKHDSDPKSDLVVSARMFRSSEHSKGDAAVQGLTFSTPPLRLDQMQTRARFHVGTPTSLP